MKVYIQSSSNGEIPQHRTPSWTIYCNFSPQRWREVFLALMYISPTKKESSSQTTKRKLDHLKPLSLFGKWVGSVWIRGHAITKQCIPSCFDGFFMFFWVKRRVASCVLCIQSNGISLVSRCWVLLDPMGSILSTLRETWQAFNGKQKTAKQTKRMFLFYPKRIYEYTSVLEGVEYTSQCNMFFLYDMCETVYPRCSMYGIFTYIYPPKTTQFCR